MKVLGISPLDKDSTVSFLEDGRVLFACGEERLSRVKLQNGFPHRAIEAGLNYLGWEPGQIDAIGYAFYDWQEEARLIEESFSIDASRVSNRSDASCQIYRSITTRKYVVNRSAIIPGIDTVDAEFMPRKSWYKRLLYDQLSRSPKLDRLAHDTVFKKWHQTAVREHKKWSEELQQGLKKVGLAKTPLRRFHHHDTHAANAFYASPYRKALVVTLDGYGSGMCGGIYSADETGIHSLVRFPFPNSLGLFYEQVTSGLGFKPSRHEGKIVGLAAYGDPRHLAELLLARFETPEGQILVDCAQNHFLARALSRYVAKRDIAAAYQFVLEEVARRVVSYWLAKTGHTHVVMSGGVHANVKLNQRIREIPSVRGVFVYPNMGDGGCGTGAAMLVFGHEVMQRTAGYQDVYFGPDFREDEVKAVLEQESLKYDRLDEPEDRIAELLAKDHIVGRHQGRMEYGPRALGNRSVLYPAKEPEVNQWLNQQLQRTEFMPFAPSCLAESAADLFDHLEGSEKTAEFMTITFNCSEVMKNHSPAAVHVDGTARPQLVTASSNPSYHRLLTAYRNKTGIPVLINTSFNMHEEPIICSPSDAVRAFLLGNLDYLAIGNYLVPHPKLAENLAARSKRAVTPRA
ncbi:MAG: carbamoyltransferase family protein [Fimbriiglobus sp.]